MIKFPYGISDFSTIRHENFLYLDRTGSISELEQAGKQLLFLRPRRFGKSLLLSTLASYYDLNQAEQFDALFGDLLVGQNPTSEHNQYMIMQWDFSMVSPQGNTEQLKQSLFHQINASVKEFTQQYQNLLKVSVDVFTNDALASFRSAMDAAKASGYQVYLLIDEYDNFANEVLMHNQGDKQRYLALLEGEGILKTLFKIIKAGASDGKIARVFITGVSPVVMSDMTSGYNVAKHISLDPRFNTLCGITAEELESVTAEVLGSCQHGDRLAAVMTTMQQFYDGYRFCTAMDQPHLYNPILCFHFLENYQLECSAPRNMLDGNLAMDAGRIRYIANLQGGQAIIDQVLDEQKSVILTELATDFGISNLERAQHHSGYMLSLLYYFGVLTLNGISDFGGLKLTVPNLVVRGLYLEELKRQSLPNTQSEAVVEKLALQFYQDADLQPVIDFMEQKYFKVFSNRDYRWSNELTIKTAFASLLFNDLYYILDSEAELARRYTDLVLIIRPHMRQYPGLQDFALEFKYLTLDELGLSGEALKGKSVSELEALPKVTSALQDALKQLEHYQQVLVQKYQEPQRLHCIAVVALGFERVIWANL